MKIKSITIEGMHNVVSKTYVFNNLTYLHGPNGAGKSTVLQAIQLALLGYIPGMSKKNDALFRHAKNNVLSVTCHLDNNGQDVTVSRSLIKTGTSVSKTLSVEPESLSIEGILAEIELPIFNFSEFLQLSGNQMKDWFLSFLPASSDSIDWNKELVDSLGDKKVIDPNLLSATIDHIQNTRGSGVSLVRDTNAYLKDQLSFLKGELARVNSTIQSLVYYDNSDLTQSSDEIRDQLTKANKLYATVCRVESVRASNRRIQNQLDAIKTEAATLDQDTQYAELSNRWKSIADTIEGVRSTISQIQDRSKSITLEINELLAKQRHNDAIIKGDGICPYTKSSCTAISELVDDLKAENEQMAAEGKAKVELLHRVSTEETDQQIKLKDLIREGSQISAQMETIRNNYESKAKLSAQFQIEELIDGEEMSAQDVLDKIGKLQDQLSRVEANARYTAMTESLTADKYKIENSIEVIKLWITLTGPNKLQSDMMNKPFQRLESSITHNVQMLFNDDNITASFTLSDKANSFNFGIVRDRKYILYDLLSSGEKCLFAISLMISLLEEAHSSLKVIIIDDMLDHLDDKNIENVFDALYNVEPVQFILAGVKECTSSNKDSIVVEI